MTSWSTVEEVASTSAGLDESEETNGSPRLTANAYYEDITIGGEPQTEETRARFKPNSYQQTQTKYDQDVAPAASHPKRFRTPIKSYLTVTSATSHRTRMRQVSAEGMFGAVGSRKGPDPARAPSPAAFSPDEFVSEEKLNNWEDEDDAGCRQLWFLCTAFATTMVIPVGLIILGYLSYSGKSLLSTSTTVVTLMTRLYPGRIANQNSSTFLDQNCLGMLNLNDNVENMTHSAYSRLRSTKTVSNFFCVFNNSRFRKNQNFDYLPDLMPFGLCPYVIYWSMSIEDGRVTSRVPEFDRRYGIWELKNTSDRLSGNKTKVLMTLGGYPEDSPHFAKLGKDTVAMDSLVADIVTCITGYRLDGIALHWVLQAGSCRPRNVSETLLALFGNLKRLLTLNNLTALITLIIPYGDDASVGSLGNMVDFFFFATHDYRPVPPTPSLCDDIVGDTLRSITSLPEYNLYQKRLCVGISMGVFRLNVSLHGGVTIYNNYSTSSRFPGVPGMAPWYELCGGQRLTHLLRDSCAEYVVRVQNSATSLIFAFMRAEHLENFLYLDFTPGSGGPSSRCVLVADLDFDIYKRTCSLFSLYRSLQRLYGEVR